MMVVAVSFSEDSLLQGLDLLPVSSSLLAVVAVAILCVLGSRWQLQTSSRIYRPASTLPIVGNFWDMIKNERCLHDWLADQFIASKGNPILTTAPGIPDMVVIASPALVEDVVKTQFDHFDKGAHQRGNLTDLLGGGILAADGPQWVHQRKTASNLFSMRALRDSMAKIMQKHTVTLRELLDDAAQERRSLDLYQLLNRFTIESFAEIAFGVNMDCLEETSEKHEHPFQTAFDSVQYQLTQRFKAPVWLWKAMRFLNVGWEATLAANLAVINDTVLDIIAESFEQRRASHQGKQQHEKATDLISLFLDHAGDRDASENDLELDPKLLRDIVVNFLMAGRDTTAQALSWFFFALSSHPDVEHKLREELKSKVPALFQSECGDSAARMPSMDEVQSLVYLEACLKETLRLYPSIPFIFRSACKDTTLSDGTFVPKGSNLGISTYSMGRMTHIWGADAREFRPERWIDAATGKLAVVSPYKFSAFHGGPRMCLGMNLSMLEMKIVVAGLVSKFHVNIVLGQQVTYATSLTLGMKNAFMVSVTQANRGAAAAS